MIHGKVLEKFVEYQEYLSDDTAMVCAILDVRLLGLLNIMGDDPSVRVTPEKLKMAGDIYG